MSRPASTECGTHARYQWHRRRGQECEPCRTAYLNTERTRRLKRLGRTDTLLPFDELLNEIQFLLRAGEGQQRILEATGYKHRAPALEKRLQQRGHLDIVHQIFRPWDHAA